MFYCDKVNRTLNIFVNEMAHFEVISVKGLSFLSGSIAIVEAEQSSEIHLVVMVDDNSGRLLFLKCRIYFIFLMHVHFALEHI